MNNDKYFISGALNIAFYDYEKILWTLLQKMTSLRMDSEGN